MDEMEKLLAQLKTEYEQKPASPPSSQTPIPSEQKRSPVQSSSPLDKLLAEIKTEIEQPKNNLSPVAKPSQIERSHHFSDDSTLKDLQAEFKAQEQLEKQRQQQALQEQQRLERERQQRKQQALQQQAQEWLKKLNPSSEEGMWFEEFSYSYEDKLEAAMHYLEALRETQR
jgi:multidrug efflux pump subunit AcrA (membrane-fusion protein)